MDNANPLNLPVIEEALQEMRKHNMRALDADESDLYQEAMPTVKKKILSNLSIFNDTCNVLNASTKNRKIPCAFLLIINTILISPFLFCVDDERSCCCCSNRWVWGRAMVCETWSRDTWSRDPGKSVSCTRELHLKVFTWKNMQMPWWCTRACSFPSRFSLFSTFFFSRRE